MQPVSEFCIFLWLPEAEQLLQVINSGDRVFLFCADGEVISHCSSLNMRFMRQSLGITSTHNLLQPPSCKVESSFS